MTAPVAHIQLFTDSAGRINWRLLSGNNRESGRGATGMPDEAACLASITHLRDRLAAATARVRRADAHRWRWELSVGGSTLAASARTFDRAIRCELAVAQFVGHFREAQLRPGVLVLGTRRFERTAS